MSGRGYARSRRVGARPGRLALDARRSRDRAGALRPRQRGGARAHPGLLPGAWEYEPTQLPDPVEPRRPVVESFAPDFYLPELDLYLELTTLRQSLVRKKNRKLRRLRSSTRASASSCSTRGTSARCCSSTGASSSRPPSAGPRGRLGTRAGRRRKRTLAGGIGAAPWRPARAGASQEAAPSRRRRVVGVDRRVGRGPSRRLARDDPTRRREHRSRMRSPDLVADVASVLVTEAQIQPRRRVGAQLAPTTPDAS